MSDPDRIPCCIVGCRRTFKTEALGDGHNEFMCGKHFRVDPELVRRLRRVRQLWGKADRKGYRAFQDGNIPMAATMSALMDRLAAADREIWTSIKDEAQRQQDAGFFAPKPRSRRKTVEAAPTDRLAAGFEDQFQRLKKAQAAARSVC